MHQFYFENKNLYNDNIQKRKAEDSEAHFSFLKSASSKRKDIQIIIHTFIPTIAIPDGAF